MPASNYHFLSDGRLDGVVVTRTSEPTGFFGFTPVVQPSGAAQGAITDSSGGAANPTTGVAALTGTYNSTIIANALATVIAQTNAMRSGLVALGLLKGGA